MPAAQPPPRGSQVAAALRALRALRVGVDAWNLPHDRRGIGRYVKALLRRWTRAQEQRVDVTLIVPERPAFLHAGRYAAALGGRRLTLASRQSAARMGLDVIWYPWNGMSWTAPGRRVATLHDASPFALPPADLGVRQRAQEPFRCAAIQADRIITDSYFSKRELVGYLALDPADISVVHLGVDMPPQAEGMRRPPLPPGTSRFLLFVGELDERKGLTTLLGAWQSLPPGLREPTALLVAGRLPANRPQLQSASGLRLLGHVRDEELASLYTHAAALVYPSSYEGFGLPVLEAMAHGTPVIAADGPGIREAGGDAARYFTPGDERALRSAIERVLAGESVAAAMRAGGLARAAAMSWDATADQTLAVLSEGGRGRGRDEQNRV
ncbi:MAG: glycosyltransferase family 4 protein [Candidatus Eremiobacteraeota bacterium]|nr:glycosyltransferase family 4 protein [Candidatus Eremiobacteraeota bacterium]